LIYFSFSFFELFIFKHGYGKRIFCGVSDRFCVDE
jgi:hypothetical protein